MMYTFKTSGNGFTLEILNPQGKSVAFLQGDDAANLLDEIGELEESWGRPEYFETFGSVFKSEAEHISYLLEQYDLMWQE